MTNDPCINTSLFTRSLSQVEKFINKYGLDYTMNQRDEYGHTPTHWLALNGHAHVFR